MSLPVLGNIPYSALIVASLFLGLAPFFPEPHLVEKFRMLMQGTLKRPIDIFDLVFHLSPLILLALKLLTEGLPGRT